MNLFCEKCGNKIGQNDNFCEYCGTHLNSEIPASTNKSITTKIKKLPWTIIVITGLLLNGYFLVKKNYELKDTLKNRQSVYETLEKQRDSL